MNSLCDKLFNAIRSDNLKNVQNTIDAGVDVNCTNIVGATPLHVAVRYKLEKIVEILINNGANVNTEHGEPPLINAIDMGKIKIIERLVDNGADINYVYSDDGKTPFTYALYLDSTEIAKLFISRGANVDQMSVEGVTPLMIVCGNGNEELIELLLSKGANIDAKNTNGKTAFDLLKEKNNAVYERIQRKYNFLRANVRLWDLTQGHIEAQTQKDLFEYMGLQGKGQRKTNRRKTNRRKSAKMRKRRSQKK